jgi:hypothetical protein
LVVTNARARMGTRIGTRNCLPGRDCAQINECVDITLNDCNTKTQVCLDRPPPKKWECVERTPAPTPFPKLSQQKRTPLRRPFLLLRLRRPLRLSRQRSVHKNLDLVNQPDLGPSGCVLRVPSSSQHPEHVNLHNNSPSAPGG